VIGSGGAALKEGSNVRALVLAERERT